LWGKSGRQKSKFHKKALSQMPGENSVRLRSASAAFTTSKTRNLPEELRLEGKQKEARGEMNPVKGKLVAFQTETRVPWVYWRSGKKEKGLVARVGVDTDGGEPCVRGGRRESTDRERRVTLGKYRLQEGLTPKETK